MAKKKLTLEQTWKYCLAMWKWIAEQKKDGSRKRVRTLKAEWLKAHNFEGIFNNCFFCNWAGGWRGNMCSYCPSLMVDPDVHGEYINWCFKPKHHWEESPEAFYAELLRLNKIRKGKKAKVKRG